MDNDLFGALEKIAFVSDTNTIFELLVDQTQPGAFASISNIEGVSGIVLPGGAFYDNLTFSVVAVPEPSTWGAIGAAGCVLIALRRRRRA